MTFRLANINNRAALLDSDNNYYYDLAAISDGAIGPDLWVPETRPWVVTRCFAG